MQTWIRNSWQVVAFPHEIGRSLLARRVLNERLVFYRTQDGVAVAMADRCPHRLVPLSAGELKGDRVRCGYHGLEFGPDGACQLVPGETRIPPNARVQTYPVVERYNVVWAWLGDADLADPALIPDLHWMDDPGWTPSNGYHHMECDFRLVTDNLLDLSHETYIHKHTIGNAAVADSPVRALIDRERVIRAHREMPDIDPPPFFRRLLGYEGRIDRWQTAIYMPAGLHVTEAGFYPVGGDRSRAFVHRVLHIITPETQHTSHYFWATCRNYRLNEPDITQYTIEATRFTFNEDKAMLEMQQKALLEYGEPHIPQVTVAVDAAPIQARRLLSRAVAAEIADPRCVQAPVPIIVEDHEPVTA
ncbi:MAG: Vanillate O-demethylase monooxygenase subunit [Hyphomicrobiales bacterium]|nr:Vanillate O-demethylase monooxygenase subunit [Hyphomicrobiales bacterium]